MEPHLRTLAAELGSESDIAAAVAIRRDWTLEHLVPRPDAVSTLEELRRRGHRLGMISACSAEVPEVWEQTPFGGLFDSTVFSCSVGVSKPDPRIYEIACEELGVEAEDCLFVGDGANDELPGAERVGMTRAPAPRSRRAAHRGRRALDRALRRAALRRARARRDWLRGRSSKLKSDRNCSASRSVAGHLDRTFDLIASSMPHRALEAMQKSVAGSVSITRSASPTIRGSTTGSPSSKRAVTISSSPAWSSKTPVGDRLPAFAGRPHRVDEPAGSEAVVRPRRAERSRAPAAQGIERLAKLLAVRRELVDVGRRRRGKLALLDDAGRLEIAEPVREDVRADSGQGAAARSV